MLDVRSNGVRRTYLTEALPTDEVCRVLRIPNDPHILRAVEDMLAYLTLQWVWQPTEEVEEYQIRAAMTKMFTEFMESDGCMIGAVIDTARATLPDNWLPCNGATYNRVDYPRLYAVLDSSLILDADTFKTPLLNGRTTIGENLVDEFYDADWEIREFGQHGGEERHALIVSELASHGHSTIPHHHTYTTVGIPVPIVQGELLPANVIVNGATASTDNVEVSIEPSGSGQTHENMMPFRVMRKAIVAR